MEGLADGESLNPVQQAFIEEQAAQCGYCTSGMVIAAVGLLREHPAPTEEQVREALDGHLCRCGTQGRIVRAVLNAAARVPGGQAVPPRPAAWEVLASQVPAGDTQPGEGPTLAPPPALAGPVVAESGVRSSTSALPADLAANPVLSQWLDFSRDGEVTISTRKVEYGQGIWTALAQVAAEELRRPAAAREPARKPAGAPSRSPGPRGCPQVTPSFGLVPVDTGATRTRASPYVGRAQLRDRPLGR